MQTASVYGLKDTRNEEVFYIGISVDPYVRYGQHLAATARGDNPAKDDRILDMRKDGLMPELVIFEKDIPTEQALNREKYWIQYHMDLGISLTNIMHCPKSGGNVYTVKDIAEILMVSERTVFRLVKNGELNGTKSGREWHFEKDDLEKFVRLSSIG